MPRMSREKRLEWSFFLNHRNRIAYNALSGNRCPLPPLLVQTVEAAGWGSKTAPHPRQRATVFQRTPMQRKGVSCFTTAPTHT